MWPLFVMCLTMGYLINCRDGVSVGHFKNFVLVLCLSICTDFFCIRDRDYKQQHIA